MWKRKQRPDHDPMREIDLLLMEDLMMHRNFPTDARAKVAQTRACWSCWRPSAECSFML
jgi:hypothetical protein